MCGLAGLTYVGGPDLNTLPTNMYFNWSYAHESLDLLLNLKYISKRTLFGRLGECMRNLSVIKNSNFKSAICMKLKLVGLLIAFHELGTTPLNVWYDAARRVASALFSLILVCTRYVSMYRGVLRKIMHDPEYFPEPDKFNPEPIYSS